MATVLIRTIAGAAYDKAVRDGVQPADPLQHLVLLKGSPVLDAPAILALTAAPGVELHRFSRTSEAEPGYIITEDTATRTRYEAHLPTTTAFPNPITGVAFLRASGALWGYAPYLPADGGLLKTNSWSYTLDVLIVEKTDDLPLDVAYYPYDYTALRERLIAAVLEQIANRQCDISLAPLDSPTVCTG
ncbi:MAG: hypothetical protein BWK73_04645 [Thiothrix lacustris]|uniref:Uncharacterized protein n=1 Tax=Thiothrix lacustris TaxID=525917 RepID=A0A1Y1QXT3_9GAMM|nr:MAG: hypothetical protein BWK73_04645 [Thiothrix lacustris]